MAAMNVGVVGCGMIRQPYMQACGDSKWLNLAACADLRTERAEDACVQAAQEEWGTPVACTYEEMLARDDIGLVMNLTNPQAHFPVSLQALEAGKHVHGEKPLCVTREEGQQLLAAAKANGVRISSAPDTFLGNGHQTARALLDAGTIGAPTAATLFFMGPGPDGYHELPQLFFQAGAGPMFDVGVYALTMAINLLGPVRRVSAFTKTTFAERVALKECSPIFGQTFKVEVPSHVTGLLEFANNVQVTFVTSYDIKGGHQLPHMEVYGTEGTLSCPDPNNFNGVPKVRRAAEADKGWQEPPLTHGYSGRCRGIGGADLVAAEASGRPHRASGDLAYHVLDIGLALYESAETGRIVEIESTVERPAPLPEGITPDIEG